LAVVGGCFPIQHNIEPHRRYHQTVLRQLHAAGRSAELRIIRYERLNTCLAKIEQAQEQQPIDVLVFHLRTEPLMRLAKLYYKYAGDNQRVRHALNLPWLGPLRPEAHDLLLARPVLQRRPATEANPLRQQLLREVNYRLGTLVGNRRFALRYYWQLVAEVCAFCRCRGIRLVIVGPVSRPCSAFENGLSEAIHHQYVPKLARLSVPYVPALGTTDAAGNSLFFANGIHVSQAGHDHIGNLLFEAVAALVTKITFVIQRKSN
jgi:hypothetical protein